MRKTMLILAFALTAVLFALCSVASADVTFDPATGKGFVGKGDVQSAFGWNNAGLQANGAAVTFTFATVATYDVTVEWDTGSKNVTHHIITVPRVVSVSGTVQSNPRNNKNNKITGFILTGLGSTTSGGKVPKVGDKFNDGNNDKIITAVTLVTPEDGDGSGLFANYDGKSVLIWAY